MALWFFTPQAGAITTNAAAQLQLGNPSNATADTNNHDHFLIQRTVEAIDYSDNLGEPVWVSWDLTSGDVGSAQRSSSFFTDTNLPSNFYWVTDNDYNGVGGINFNRGHMCPSEDRTDSRTDNDMVFFMSNIIPQAAANNQTVWGNFESECRTLANAGNEVLITCGPSGFTSYRIPSGKAAIANYTWKIAVVVPLGGGTALSRIAASTRVISLKIPNSNSVSSTWQNYVTSAEQIEADTGFTFFTALPHNLAWVLRSKVDGQAPPSPAIAGFFPTSGVTNASVVITGTNLDSTTNVTFNGTSATFTINSPGQVTATVPFGATSGHIGVATLGGPATTSSNFTVNTSASLQSIQTVFIILMENHDWSEIKGNPSAPYINNTLLPIASHAEQYYNPPGNHPSLPNYLWLEAGTNFGILDDNDPSSNHQSTTNHLVSLLKRAGVLWTAYQEDTEGSVCPLTSVNLYAVWHDPMVYFDDVTNTNDNNSAYCVANVRPFSELAGDLATNAVTRYNFITPNLCDDMHNGGCATGDAVLNGDTWLSNNVPAIINSQAYANNGALFIVWDESDNNDGPIGMIVLSPLARGGGYSNSIPYTHSSTLRTMEEIFNVSPFLGDAANATDLSDLFSFGSTAQLSVSPASGLTSSGALGGPFSPNALDYALTNSGDATLNWTATNAANWLTLSATAGTLAPGSNVTVTVSINTNANGLAAGIYSDTISFTNTANGVGNTTRTVSLTVTTDATPDLAITKTHSGNFTQGDTGDSYIIIITNMGSAASSGTVTVTDALPLGLTATAISGIGWTTNLSTLTCTRSDSLAAGATFPPIILTVSVASNAPASITNSAIVSGGGDTNSANNTATDPTTINPAAGGGGTPITLAGWDMSGQTNYGMSPMAPTTNAANLTLIGLTRGSGVGTSGSGAARGWGGNAWTNPTPAAAIAANQFASFDIAANTGYRVSYSSVSKFDYRHSNTGPTNGLLQYQIGSGAFTTIATFSYPTNSSSQGSLNPIDLTGISALQNVAAGTNVTFRIVNWGAGGASGTWYIFDVANSSASDLVIQGTVSPVLTPIQSWRLQWYGTLANSGVAADTAIHTSDGMANLLKYALGLNPLVATNNPVVGDITTGYLRLTLPKNPDATDVGFHVEVSADLTLPSWTTNGTTVDQNTATLLQVHDNTPVSSSDRNFIRLRVSRP